MNTFWRTVRHKENSLSVFGLITRAKVIREPRYKRIFGFERVRLTFSVGFCDYLTLEIHFLLTGHKIYPKKIFTNFKIRVKSNIHFTDTNKFENHIKSRTAHVWGQFLKLKEILENIIMRVTSTLHATPPSKTNKQTNKQTNKYRLKRQNKFRA